MKKHLALILAMIMMFQMFPVSVFAEDGAAENTVYAAEETAAAPDAASLAEAGLAGIGAASSGDADRQWSAAESDDIERAEYHTVLFKDHGISRSRRFVMDGATAGEAPEGSMHKSIPVYGWTVPEEDGKKDWYDETAEITEDLTVTAVPANNAEKTDSVSAGDLAITAVAPAGAVPADADFVAEAVNKDEVAAAVASLVGEDAGEVRAVDMGYYSETVDEKVEPLEAVTVTMDVAGMNTESITVIHIPDDGDPTSVDFTVNPDGTITFLADSFSIYAIVDDGEVHEDARLTVTFIQSDGSTEMKITKNQLSQIELYIFRNLFSFFSIESSFA